MRTDPTGALEGMKEIERRHAAWNHYADRGWTYEQFLAWWNGSK